MSRTLDLEVEGKKLGWNDVFLFILSCVPIEPRDPKVTLLKAEELVMIVDEG